MTSKAKKDTEITRLRSMVKELTVLVETVIKDNDRLVLRVSNLESAHTTDLMLHQQISRGIQDIWNIIDPDVKQKGQ